MKYTFLFFLVILTFSTAATQEQPKIKSEDRKLVERMLGNIHDVLKQYYYDPSFHGIDVDVRYRTYDERVKAAESVANAFRVVAAYLSGLNDSHTIFVPPRLAYTADYGYEMEIVGDTCYVTEVRPGSDAEQKLQPGDQIISLDGYTVARKDIWQLEYYLNSIAPKPFTTMTIRSSTGEQRKVQVASKYTNHTPATYVDFRFWAENLEREQIQHILRQRFVEQADVLFWKMPSFTTQEAEIDRIIGLARRHKSLVLDLRGNPGGHVATVLRLIGSVMDHDVNVATRIMRKTRTSVLAKSRGRDVYTGNLVVLVDSRSASAAEVFARVMQLEHRGTVVGDRTSGSVMESVFHRFQDNSGVIVVYGAAITEADLIMADGKSLENVGLTPDVLVLPSAADLAGGMDPALAKAAELVGVKIDPVEASKLFPFEWSPE